MAATLKNVKLIGLVTLTLLFLAALSIIIAPTLYGVGSKVAGGLGVNTTTTFNNTVSATESSASVMSTVFTFLPWLGVGIAIILLFGGKKLLHV